MRLVVRRNRYKDAEQKHLDFNIMRTPAGILQAIPLATGRVLSYVETDTPAWQGVTARKFYAITGMLLAPFAVVAFTFAAWALTAKMNWTSGFLFPAGPFSHWIVWCGMGLALSYFSSTLRRFGSTL